ncbi:poly-beta-1,6 N-acetyl-D-glucosamine export porin PgaA [Burkholderia sp. 22PA0099]|uniref:poly-beta-1,6 N-acetyl-D-glucosamine export porin PgaA n=1 Tax=Burkholderia sp. 22PA0099 TaxID=3237372 RepID=UPI0039C1FC2B
MIEFKRLRVPPRRWPLGACAPATVVPMVLLSAYATLDSGEACAQEAPPSGPVVFMVEMPDDPASPVPAGRPMPGSAPVQEPPHRKAEPQAPTAAANLGTVGNGMPPVVHAVPMPEDGAPGPTLAAGSTFGSTLAPSPAPTPEPPPPPSQSVPEAVAKLSESSETSASPDENLRKQVLTLATGGGAVRALVLARARPDVFSPVDLARIEELSIRQEVRGGRAKVREMTSADRFDALDRAIREAEAFDQRLPATPDYAPIRASLAGDRAVAYAAHGRMKDTVAVFETIPPGSDVSIDALAAVGDAYAYLQRPDKAEWAYRRAIAQFTAPAPDAATLGYQYGAHTRLIDLREDLFYALTDQNHYVQAQQVLEDMRRALPSAAKINQWDPANDDYLRYYRLLAQSRIYMGQTATGMAGLQRLEEQVPFSAEVRDAQADAMLGNSQTRRARDTYAGTLTDHPDDVETMAGLGRASLALGDYRRAHQIDDTFGTTFPESGAVRAFKRDYAAYRAPVLSIEVNGEHGNSELADNEFSIDTMLYSPPILDNWRVFGHTYYGHANTDIGNISRTRTGIGGDYRNGGLSITGEATRSLGADGRMGANGEVNYAFNDYLSASASVDTDSNALPWKAYLDHLWGKTAQFSFNFTDTDRRSASLTYSAARYSDSNFNQEITLSGTQRVFTAANQFVNLTMNLGTGSNTIANANYYAPGRDYTAELVAMHQWSLWRSGEKGLQQRIYLTAGAYNERGFGTSPELGARIEHVWSFSHNVALTYGLGLLSHAYDGSRELSATAYGSLTVPF